MEVSGKCIVITGASSGIGAAVAMLLATKGGRVFSLDVSPPEESIPGVTSILADITNAAQIEDALKHVPSPVDILINNAGIMRRGDVLASSEADFDHLFAVNVKGSWLVTKIILPRMSKRGMMVQMSSEHALNPVSDPGLYTLTKQSASALADLVQRSYPDIIVKILFPGPVDTSLARHDVPSHVLKEKEKIMHQASEIAEKIVELIETDGKTKLLCERETKEYWME